MRDWQALAETNWTQANSKQWLCALIVYKRNIRLKSDDTSTKLRGAWKLYAFIRQYYPAKARELRKEYGYSRFYDLYKKWNEFEFPPDICIEYLESDLSNTAMAMQAEDMHGLPEWERKGAGIYSTVTKFVEVSYGAPDWFRSWAAGTKKLFEANGFK